MSSDIATSVSKNVAVMTGARFITYISSFVLMLFLPRYLGPEEYGRLYLGISITAMFSVFIDFGGRYSISKAVARTPERAGQVMVDAAAFRLLFWVASLAVLILFSFIVDYPRTVKLVLLVLGVGILLENLRGVLWSFFQGIERMEYPSYGGIAYGVFLAAAGVVALLLGANAVWIAAIMVGAEFIYFVLCMRFARRFVASFPAIVWKESIALIREGVPYFLQSIFGIIYYRLDTVMLSLMTPAAVVGWYGASYKFFDTLMFVPNIYSIAVFPVLARLWQKENDTHARLAHKSLEYILIVGIPITVGTFAFSRQIIQILFGLRGYGPSIVLLQIFALGSLLVYIDWVLGTVLLASDKQKMLSINALAAIFINLGLNYLLIPYFEVHYGNGGIGSAIATLITEFFIMCGMLYLVPKEILRNARIVTSLKAIVSGIAAAVGIWLLRSAGAPWEAQAVLACAIYPLVLLSLKTFDAAELAFFKSWLKPRSLRTLLTGTAGDGRPHPQEEPTG